MTYGCKELCHGTKLKSEKKTCIPTFINTNFKLLICMYTVYFSNKIYVFIE